MSMDGNEDVHWAKWKADVGPDPHGDLGVLPIATTTEVRMSEDQTAVPPDVSGVVISYAGCEGPEHLPEIPPIVDSFRANLPA